VYWIEETSGFNTILCYFFQEMHRISKRFGADFDEVVDFSEDTHCVRLDRPINVSGCYWWALFIPNAELLLKAYDSEVIRLILELNEKRKEEAKDEGVRREIEKIKKRAEAVEKELMKKPIK